MTTSDERLLEIDDLIEAHSARKAVVVEGEERKRLIFEVDLNEDGRPDELDPRGWVSNGKRETLGIVNLPSNPTSIGADDLDRDGRIDIWILDPGDVCLRVFYGTGNGKFWRRQVISPLPIYGKGAFTDADGDGDLDIVMKGRERIPEYVWAEILPVD